MDQVEAERSLFVTIRSLNKYPDKVLKENIDTVYLVKALSYRGVHAGGTNSRQCVYLANKGEHLGFTDQYIESTFHHEVAQIFYRNFPDYLDHKAWITQNPQGFEYGIDGVEAIKLGKANLNTADEFLQ